jgi:hypothetical protein
VIIQSLKADLTQPAESCGQSTYTIIVRDDDLVDAQMHMSNHPDHNWAQ